MRAQSDGTKTGGFYVPKGYHLRILLGEKNSGGGWYQTQLSCPNTACWGPGTSLWATRSDAYTYTNRDPLLLVELNVNTDQNNFEDTTIWFDLSAVDGVNANLHMVYGSINREVTVPLFQSEADFVDWLPTPTPGPDPEQQDSATNTYAITLVAQISLILFTYFG